MTDLETKLLAALRGAMTVIDALVPVSGRGCIVDAAVAARRGNCLDVIAVADKPDVPPWPVSKVRPGLRNDGIATRNDVQMMTSAERAITAAMVEVEHAGASSSLTEAVTLLAKARHYVANHVEGKPFCDPRTGRLITGSPA